jgi:hypothetical protein
MSCVGALRASALRVRRMESVNRLGGALKDHPREPLPGTCRSAGSSNARESVLPGKSEATRSRRCGAVGSPGEWRPHQQICCWCVKKNHCIQRPDRMQCHLGGVTGGLRATWDSSPKASRHPNRAATPAGDVDERVELCFGGRATDS